MRSYVLWLLTAVALLTMTTRAVHIRQANGSIISRSRNSSSISSSAVSNSYANDPRPDAVNEETSDILGTGGSYEFRLPKPQINNQQQHQQQHQTQHKIKRPNSTVTATYETTTKTSISSSSGSISDTPDSISTQMTTKSSTTRPSSSIASTSGNKTANGISQTTPLPVQSLKESSNILHDSSQAPNQSASMVGYIAKDKKASMDKNAKKDGDLSKKIINSSVLQSVSVVLNGNEPEYTDALGNKVPKPQVPLQVASPIDLLNPDRYEFYTFDENGELVRRLMTMEEIQSIVANGDGENSSIVQQVPIDDREPEKNVQDIVDSVQNVLNKEVESNKNISKDDLTTLDTPDVTSSWSLILPAIFGNGGNSDLFPQQKPQQIVMIPDSELLETSTSSTPSTNSSHAINTKRPKPIKRKPGQKRKPTTTTSTAMTPQVVQEELDPNESVYTGMQQYQNVAANMQNFDGFSQLQMQPIYHKLAEQQTEQTETTTRRIFVNNKEVVKGESSTRPTVSTDTFNLNADVAKRPPVVVVVQSKRPVPPNQHKTPNGGSVVGSPITQKPHGAQNKQKIKKKPPAVITTTSQAPEQITSTSTTAELITSTTAISTTESVSVTPIAPSPVSSTITPAPNSTTPKKKKKKPTRQPGQGTSKPYPNGEKRKPGAVGKPTTGKPQPNNSTQHNVHKQQHGNKPHASLEVSTIALPPPETSVETNINKHSGISSYKPNKTRPRPHKKPTVAATASTTPSTTIPTPAQELVIPETASTTTISENTLVVEHFPGYNSIPVKTPNANNRPGVPNYPVPDYEPTHHNVQTEASDSEQFKRKPLPSLAQIQQHKYKPVVIEDHQTLNSFDQIMESLKGEMADKIDEDINEPSATQKRPVTEKPAKLILTKPITETAPPANGSMKISLVHAQPIEKDEESFLEKGTVQLVFVGSKRPSILLSNLEKETEYKTTAKQPASEETTEMYKEEQENSYDSSTEEYIATLEDKRTDKIEEDSSHVVRFEPLYADVQEPIVTEISTTAKTVEETTLIDVELNSEEYSTEADANKIYQKPLVMQPSAVTSKVDTLIAEEKVSTTEPQPQIIDLKPHLNMDIIKPTDKINMSDFQTHAATVASMLVDGGNIYGPSGVNETRSELDVILSDVIQKMTGHEPDAYRIENAEDGNRLTSFAQLNSSLFLLNPTQSIKEQNDMSDYYKSTATPRPTKLDISESSEVSDEDKNAQLDSTPEFLTYAPKEDTNPSLDGDNLETEKDNLEKHDKENKAEPSEEILETNEDVHKIELENKEIYLVQQDKNTKIDILGKDEGKIEENTSVQVETTEKYEFESTDFESTTVQQISDDSSEPLKSYNIKEDNGSAEPLSEPTESETSTTLELNSEEIEGIDTTEKMFTETKKINKEEVTKDSESFVSVEEKGLEEGDKIKISGTTEMSNLNKELHTDETTQQIITNDKGESQIQTTEKITEKPKETTVEKEDEDNESQLLETQKQENVLTSYIKQKIQAKIELEANKEEEDLSKSEIEENTNGSKISSVEKAVGYNNRKDTVESQDTKNETDENESSETNEHQKNMDEKQKNSEEVDIKNYSVEDTTQKETNEQEDLREENLENGTTDEIPLIQTSAEKEENEENTTEKEASHFKPEVDVTKEDLNTDSTIKVDAAEILENTTKKENTENSEDDNVTNGNELQLQYTNVPKQDKQDEVKKEGEYNDSGVSEFKTTTILPMVDSAVTEKLVSEDVSDSSGAASVTEVIVLQQSGERISTESEEDVYIKLGETTTKSTEKLINYDLSNEKLSEEEASVHTESIDIEATTVKLHEIEVPEASTLVADKSAEKLGAADRTQLSEMTAAEPSKIVEVITTELAKDPSTLVEPTLIAAQQIQQIETARPIQEFITQQRPQQQTQLNSDLRPDAQNPTDNGDLTSYIIPKFPSSPVLEALATTSTTSKVPIASKKATSKPLPKTPTKRIHTLRPVSYYNQKHSGINIGAPKPIEPTKIIPYSANTATQQRPMLRPVQLNNLMVTSTQATRPPVKMEPSPDNSNGLEASVRNLDENLQSFVKLCNELAFSYWKSITSEKISSARSLVVSPFALTSMLSMVFLGARGSTSGEMNEVLKLDDMVTFNPHLVFKNITDSVERAVDSDISTTAFVREIFSDRANGKILQFFKEKTQQFYAGHVEEVNFHVVNDIIRRRTNLLIKRHTMGKVLEYLRTNSLWVNGPLATISANLFQTDCRKGSTHLTDGEMFFQVHPSVRQRRLIPIPAVLYKSGFTAGYEPNLDATIVAFGSIQDTVSTIYVMPGHQSTLSAADSLEHLERELVEQAISKNAWSNILTSLMDRPGMEVQLPRFSHRSFVNASLGLQKMGLKGLFKSDFADLRGLTGSSNRDIYLSDVIQINTFSTCGEEKIADHHHVEMYPAPPLRKRNKDLGSDIDEDAYDSSEAIIDFGSLVHDSALARSFYDDLLDPKYLELPLSLRPRQARVPDAPRLRFDKPFLYFVRHNPTGIILFMGRFNPRLLP